MVPEEVHWFFAIAPLSSLISAIEQIPTMVNTAAWLYQTAENTV